MNFKTNLLFKTLLISLVCCIFLVDFALAQETTLESKPIFIVGQDLKSIDDFIDSLDGDIFPHGFMVYTAINDPRGLSEPVDHGAGINHTDLLIEKYPDAEIIQIGLYMKYMLKLTAKGELDHNIEKIGNWIKNSGKKVYLRIGYEFDNADNQYIPEDYIKAYKHIVDFMRSMNIENVYFVWHSIGWKAADWPEYELDKWYPGDDYVDWIALSFFDAQQEEERIILTEFAHNKNKPLMIAESSPFNQYTIEQKLHWIKRLFDYMESSGVSFLSYINVNWDDLDLFKNEKWGDARLEQEEVLLKEFLKRTREYLKNNIN